VSKEVQSPDGWQRKSFKLPGIRFFVNNMAAVEESALETLASKVDGIVTAGKSRIETDQAIRQYLDGNIRFWDREQHRAKTGRSYSKESIKQISLQEKEGLDYLKALRVQSISEICDELIQDPKLALNFPFDIGANAKTGDHVHGLVHFTSSLFRGFLDYKFKAGWPGASFILTLQYPREAVTDGRQYSLVLFDGAEEEGKYHVGWLYHKLCGLNNVLKGR